MWTATSEDRVNVDKGKAYVAVNVTFFIVKYIWEEIPGKEIYMSTKTPNYNLTLPAQTDYYDVDIFNENYGIIDEALKALKDAQEALAEVATSGIYNDLTAIPFRTVSNRQELSDAIGSLGDGGGRVYLMPGVFDLTDSNFSIGGDGVMLTGSGKGTVLKLGANTKLSFLGNRCGIKNLTLTREAASTMELLLLDSGMETQFAGDFIMDNVYIDCINANGSTGFIEITSSGAKNFRLLNTVVNTDQAGILVNCSTGIAHGIISGCCSNYPLTVPSGFTLGANINITEG